MRRFELVVAVTLVAALVSCAPARLSSPDGLALGAPHPLLERRAPDFVPPTTSAFDPKACEGKVVVIHFWATWAEASRATLPKLQSLYAKYKERGVEVVAISVDEDKALIDETIEALDVRFPIGWDARKEIAGRWLVKSVPASFVVDRRGVVRAAFVRYDDGVDVEIETDVRILAADAATEASVLGSGPQNKN